MFLFSSFKEARCLDQSSRLELIVVFISAWTMWLEGRTVGALKPFMSYWSQELHYYSYGSLMVRCGSLADLKLKLLLFFHACPTFHRDRVNGSVQGAVKIKVSSHQNAEQLPHFSHPYVHHYYGNMYRESATMQAKLLQKWSLLKLWNEIAPPLDFNPECLTFILPH